MTSKRRLLKINTFIKAIFPESVLVQMKYLVSSIIFKQFLCHSHLLNYIIRKQKEPWKHNKKIFWSIYQLTIDGSQCFNIK